MATIGYFFMVVGATFMALAGLGILRMPDTLNRIQAGTKATTLGLMSILFGIGVYEPQYLLKSLVIIIFIAISNPIGSSVLARAAYKCDKFELVTDDLKEHYEGGNE